MTDCCDNFSSTVTEAERLPNCIWRAHDDCGYKAQYKGLDGAQFEPFMPVKFSAVPGEVEPALDGVDAIGFASVSLLSSSADNNVAVIRSAAELPWKCVAEAIGASPTDAAAWWAIHIELAKAGVYIAF